MLPPTNDITSTTSYNWAKYRHLLNIIINILYCFESFFLNNTHCWHFKVESARSKMRLISWINCLRYHRILAYENKAQHLRWGRCTSWNGIYINLTGSSMLSWYMRCVKRSRNKYSGEWYAITYSVAYDVVEKCCINNQILQYII